MLTLNQQQLTELEKLLLEFPGKFCNPILDFLFKVQQENAAAVAEKDKKEITQPDVT